MKVATVPADGNKCFISKHWKTRRSRVFACRLQLLASIRHISFRGQKCSLCNRADLVGLPKWRPLKSGPVVALKVRACRGVRTCRRLPKVAKFLKKLAAVQDFGRVNNKRVKLKDALRSASNPSCCVLSIETLRRVHFFVLRLLERFRDWNFGFQGGDVSYLH